MKTDNLQLSLHFLISILFIYSSFYASKGLAGASTERNALLIFKLKVSDPQNILRDWTHNTSHCTWYGVRCSVSGDRVRSLNLSGAGLSGTLTPQLSNLTSLELLDLTDNSFYGPIPSEFGLLSNLQYLILRRNSFNDTIPPTLSECRKLKSISLLSNKLVGNIPSQLGYLSRLERLDFSENNLTGSIPSTFGNLTSLSMLILFTNQLSGGIPSQLGSLQRLYWVQLYQNRLSGEIPSSIFNISSLVFVSLANNKLSGKLPDDMAQTLPNLEELYLVNNSLEGFIPTSLTNSSRIISLDLSFNGFHGPIPLFGNMKGLVSLVFDGNYLNSNTNLNFQLVDSLRNCTSLEVFKVSSNNLSGLFPSSISNLSTHLQHFCFSHNFLYGSFPKGMENLHGLVSLSWQENYFSGEIPETIGNLKNLQSFLVYSNMFSGEIPDIFGNLSKLAYLGIRDNHFSGKIPASIGACQRLRTLSLKGNKFSGSIPSEIFGLATLVWLNMAENSLTGSLPSQVGNLKQLEFLDVSGNRLSGNVTSSIGNCLGLLKLNLSRNYFTGRVPDTVGKLASLQELDLSSNRLTGLIPDVLVNLQDLRILNLSFNELEGIVPSDGGVFLNSSSVYLQGNNRLCLNNRSTAEIFGIFPCNRSKRRTYFWVKIIVPTVAIMLSIILMSCLVKLFMSMKKHKPKRDNISTSLMGLSPKISYEDIKLATDNFAAENLLGKGGFGTVYKGWFNSDEIGSRKTILAVKVLDLHQSKASKSFDAECEVLRNVKHRNLVKLITSCSSIEHNGDEFKALIMEFMPRGSLENLLYYKGAETDLSLTLLQRLNIVIDVAFAMDYLHHDCIPPVVHCDLKPGNVLLDNDMVAHVVDFGLGRILSDDSGKKNESTTTGLKGSVGYIPAEYGVGGKAATAGDVYSFGIVVLETFVAKKPTDDMFNDGLSLMEFASTIDETNVAEIADPNLFIDDGTSSVCATQSTSSGYTIDSNATGSSGTRLDICEKCVSDVIRVGLSCAARSVVERMTMREALLKLQEIKKVLLQM